MKKELFCEAFELVDEKFVTEYYEKRFDTKSQIIKKYVLAAGIYIAAILAVALIVPFIIGNGNDPKPGTVPPVSDSIAIVTPIADPPADSTESPVTEPPVTDLSEEKPPVLTRPYPNEMYNFYFLSKVYKWADIEEITAALEDPEYEYYDVLKDIPLIYWYIKELDVPIDVFIQANEELSDEQIEILYSDKDFETIKKEAKSFSTFYQDGRFYLIDDLLKLDYSSLIETDRSGELSEYLNEIKSRSEGKSHSTWQKLYDASITLMERLEEYPPYTPDVLDDDLAEQIKELEAEWIRESYGYDATAADVTIENYYGTHNGGVVFMSESRFFGFSKLPRNVRVAGVLFLYEDGNDIHMWKDGERYNLNQAYENGFLTVDDLKKIAYVQKYPVSHPDEIPPLNIGYHKADSSKEEVISATLGGYKWKYNTHTDEVKNQVLTSENLCVIDVSTVKDYTLDLQLVGNTQSYFEGKVQSYTVECYYVPYGTVVGRWYDVKTIVIDPNVTTYYKITAKFARGTVEYGFCCRSDGNYEQSLPFSVKYVNTPVNDPSGMYPIAYSSPMRSQEQINKHLDYLLTCYEGKPLFQNIDGFRQATKEYDDAFFENNSLLFVRLEGNPSKIQYTLQSVIMYAPPAGFDTELDTITTIYFANDPSDTNTDTVWHAIIEVPTTVITDIYEARIIENGN